MVWVGGCATVYLAIRQFGKTLGAWPGNDRSVRFDAVGHTMPIDNYCVPDDHLMTATIEMTVPEAVEMLRRQESGEDDAHPVYYINNIMVKEDQPRRQVGLKFAAHAKRNFRIVVRRDGENNHEYPLSDAPTAKDILAAEKPAQREAHTVVRYGWLWDLYCWRDLARLPRTIE